MLTPAEAQAAILEAMPQFPTVRLPSSKAVGAVLRESVFAERDQPPFDRVMMDGIALRHADFATGTRSFPVQAMQAAGDAELTLRAGHSIEIMTGASLPLDADCIVPVERISVADGIATVQEDYDAEPGRFIHPRASDHSAGAELLRPGKRISAPDIAVIASAGLTEIVVSRAPVISVFSTGNELVEAGEPIAAHQIRSSNGPAINALLGQHGYAEVTEEHLADDLQQMRERIDAHLAAADVLILSGGVSMGKADFVPRVLIELGVKVLFHRITQRPGKPMWFGIGPRQQAVFALPGNPVSALVCCRQYVIPALNSASSAMAPLPEFASLATDVTFEPDLTCFQPVRVLSSAAAQTLAVPVPTNTSGDFTALSATDGYVELAREQSLFPAGTVVLLHRWS